MRIIAVAAAVLTVSTALACAANAAPKKRYPVVERSAAGTVIQPTRTIIHHPNGTTTIIVTPRHRSYLDPGTETKTHQEHFLDHAYPPSDPFSRFQNDYNFTSIRNPFPSCLDLAGFCR